MKDRVADLHRRSTQLPGNGSPDPDRQPRNDRRGWFGRVPWGFLTFLMAVVFGVWRFIPPGYLPQSMTYASVIGRQEGSTQSAATEASMNSMAAAEALKSGAVANASMPANVATQVTIANETAPIEITKNQTIAANQARIQQVQICRQTIMQGAGQAYASCVAAAYEPGSSCDNKRDIILERYPDCGVLPGEPANQTTPSSPTGGNP